MIMSPSLTRCTGHMHRAPRNVNVCLLALWTLQHLLYFVLRQPASLITVMDPFHLPVFRVIHKFRTRNHNTQAVLPTHAAGETHHLGGLTQHQHFGRKLEKDLFGNEQTHLLGYDVHTGIQDVSKILVQNSGLNSQHQNNKNTSYQHTLHTNVRLTPTHTSYR